MLFGTNFSPSTFLRPIIPTVAAIYVFFKKDAKFKKQMLGIGVVYLIYAVLHLWVFKQTLTGSSYGGITNEAQYVINYSYMIVNLILYVVLFTSKEDCEKLTKSILIANSIYIVSIVVAIATKTSSNTYIEGIGYKGWFESGNCLGAILTLSLFLIIPYVKDKKYRKVAIPLILIEGIYLTTLLGTRVGLLGFIVVIMGGIGAEIMMALKRKGKINKKLIVGGVAVIASVLLVVITIGSTTLQRRKHLRSLENETVETMHITASILEIKEKIDNNSLEEGYMKEAQKQSILDLYNIANQWKIKNHNQRKQQLIYNAMLIKNQKNPVYLLLGNGYVANFRELVLEMEIPAFFMNFGLVRRDTLFYTICCYFWL